MLSLAARPTLPLPTRRRLQSCPILQARRFDVSAYAAVTPPWSAERAIANLYGPKAAVRSVPATVVGNVRVTDVGKDYDTHHIVLDFGAMTFPVLEGQSIGVVPPGTDADGRPHHPRQYSVASPRNGERPDYNNVSLTVKRVLEDHQGRPVRGVASNYLCDLAVGDTVEATGPFGVSFLMPNHPKSAIVMICTGTGSAPMRAMTEWRRRLRKSGKFEGGKLMLFFGARTKEELPYFGPLLNLPRDFIDINFAFSRTQGEPKRYVQDAMRERAADLAPLIADPDAYFYVCGLRAMEEGVVTALRDIANKAGFGWETAWAGAQARRPAASGNVLSDDHEEKPMTAEDILSDSAGSMSAESFVEISYDDAIPNNVALCPTSSCSARSRAGGRNISTGGAAWARSATSSRRSICAPPSASIPPAGPSSAM